MWNYAQLFMAVFETPRELLCFFVAVYVHMVSRLEIEVLDGLGNSDTVLSGESPFS